MCLPTGANTWVRPYKTPVTFLNPVHDFDAITLLWAAVDDVE